MKYKGTLIVVKDCNRALKFYRDLFGLQLLQEFVERLEMLYPETKDVNHLMTHSWGKR